MMTREEKLYSMTMGCLVEVANKLGIKIDKKGAKSKAVAKILEAEQKQAEAMSVDESKLVPMPGAEKLADVDKEVKKIQDKKKAEKKQKAKKEITNPEDISDDEYVAEVMEQKKELGIECPPIEKVEIVKEKKQKKEKVVKAVIDSDSILKYVYAKVKKLGGEVITSDKNKLVTFKVNGNMFARLSYSAKNVILRCRTKAVSIKTDRTVNYLFDGLYVFTDMSDTKSIDTLLTESIEYQKNKKTKKEEK